MLSKVFKISCSIFLVMALVFSVAITTFAESSDSIPVINYFKVDNDVVTIGKNVVFEWDVDNADSVVLEEGGDIEALPIALELKGSYTACPLKSDVYTLKVSKGDITVISQLYVQVKNVVKPVIEYLKVSPATIELGETAIISWKVKNADEVYVSGKRVGSEGSISVTPDEVGTYKYNLIAYGNGVAISSYTNKLVVKEVPPKVVKIISFSADKTEVSRGELVKLSWEAENASGCMIYTSDGLRLMDRPAKGSISITPNETRSYTLIAYGDQQNVDEKTIEIVVK